MGFETATPDEALVISGFCHKEPFIEVGVTKFVFSGIQNVQRISLKLITLDIISSGANTRDGVPINVRGTAQVKIPGNDRKLLEEAVRCFLGKTDYQIKEALRQTMEGHQRAIIGTLTPEEPFKTNLIIDKDKFSKAMYETAYLDLRNFGFTITSYTINDQNDDNGYYESLGKKANADVHAKGRIGKAQAEMKSDIAETNAQRAEMESKFTNLKRVRESERDKLLQAAINEKEVQTKRAISDLAKKLQEAKTKQNVKIAEMEVKVEEKRRQIEIQEQEIMRRKKELDARIRKPAEAEKYKMEIEAEAARQRMVLEAEGEAELIKLQGEAEAFAINEKAKAEAQQMRRKAEAWNKYQDAAIVDMILDTLPQVAQEIAAPLANARKITMVSTGGGDIGCAKLAGEVLDIVSNLPTMVQSLTGVNITPKKQ